MISGYWIDLKCDSSDKFKERYDSMVYLTFVVIVKGAGGEGERWVQHFGFLHPKQK